MSSLLPCRFYTTLFRFYYINQRTAFSNSNYCFDNNQLISLAQAGYDLNSDILKKAGKLNDVFDSSVFYF